MGEINQSIISDRSGRVSSELSAGFFLVSGFFLLSFFLPFSPPPPPPPPVLCLSFERILLECFSRFLWCFSGIIGDIFLKIIDDPVGFPSGFSQVERKRTRCSCRDSIRILSVLLSFCLYLVGSFLSDSDCCPND